MSKSYVVNEGGKLLMIGRGKSALPEGSVSEADAAVLLSVEPAEVVGEIMSLRTNLNAECRTAKVGDDEYVFNGEDVRDLARQKMRGEHRRRRPAPPSPAPAPRQRIELSDSHTVTPPPSESTAAILLADAAEQAGLTEDQMTTRVLGRARMKVVDGQMVVSKADLDRLAADGAIPKPSDRAKVDAMVAEAEGKPTRNASVEARTDRMERALGVGDGEDRRVTDRTAKVAASLGVEGMDKPDQGEHKPESRSGVITAKADDREPYRLGAPKRWGQR